MEKENDFLKRFSGDPSNQTPHSEQEKYTELVYYKKISFKLIILSKHASKQS